MVLAWLKWTCINLQLVENLQTRQGYHFNEILKIPVDAMCAIFLFHVKGHRKCFLWLIQK